MDARLFFAMVRRGRGLESKRKSRMYFELIRVINFPHAPENIRKELIQWHYDNSLTDFDREYRDYRIKQMNATGEGYAHPAAALDFFGRAGLRK